jgi:hypothetical protein
MSKVKEKFKILIDQTPFEVENQFITGAEIRALGNIPNDYKIYLKVNGPGDDKEIANADKVDLSEPGREHFYSAKPNTNNG